MRPAHLPYIFLFSARQSETIYISMSVSRGVRSDINNTYTIFISTVLFPDSPRENGGDVLSPNVIPVVPALSTGARQ